MDYICTITPNLEGNSGKYGYAKNPGHLYCFLFVAIGQRHTILLLPLTDHIDH